RFVLLGLKDFANLRQIGGLALFQLGLCGFEPLNFLGPVASFVLRRKRPLQLGGILCLGVRGYVNVVTVPIDFFVKRIDALEGIRSYLDINSDAAERIPNL